MLEGGDVPAVELRRSTEYWLDKRAGAGASAAWVRMSLAGQMRSVANGSFRVGYRAERQAHSAADANA